SVGSVGDAPNLYHAVGFNGEGVVMTQLAGRIVAEMIAKQESPLAELAIVDKPMPYIGPEPIRSAAALLTRRLRHW
ncbi:MAG: hypothetical protein OEY15_12510, partial [Myxococcales bacterium]|nr:hypothetical protein [Myxococcales bacterium]